MTTGAHAVLAICNWERFQHYKDRDPPWVKLYRDMLTAESWVLGTDISRLVQVASILLAARYSNQIPFRWALIRKVASLDCTEAEFHEAIQHLTATKFLEIQGCTELEGRPVHDASAVLAKCSRETEAEQSRDREEGEKKSMSASPTARSEPGAVDRIFEHWRETWNHPRAQLDDKRRRVIRKALADGYDEAALCQAITGYRNSPHHMGENDRGTVYDAIDLFLRDAKHIDAGLKFYHDPPRRNLSTLTRRNVAATEGWVPPELRHAAK